MLKFWQITAFICNFMFDKEVPMRYNTVIPDYKDDRQKKRKPRMSVQGHISCYFKIERNLWEMAEKKNIMTYAGLKKLEDELHDLKVVRRQEVAGKIREAREQGDLSENAEYDAAKEAQAHLEDKINQMKMTIADAKIIDKSRLSADCVQLLSKVVMTNLATNTSMTYTIVSEQEANLKEGKISIKTPIAQGLLNKKVGDEAEIKIPRGTIKLRIDSISID